MFKKIQHFALSAISKIRGLISSAVESLLMQRLTDKSDRAFARDFFREAAPVLIFIICVYGVFWFLGFIEELLTITILAAFAWCAKMEKYYRGSAIFSSALNDYDSTGHRTVIACCEFIRLAPFTSRWGKGTENMPSIVVGILTGQEQQHTIQFYIVAYNCPEYKPFHRLYRFMKIPQLFRDVREIIQTEMKYRNVKTEWTLNWDDDFQMGYRSILSGDDFFPISFGITSRGTIMLLTSMYVWFWLRFRHKKLGWLVRHIGESTGKILYFFHRGEAIARKMSRGEQSKWE